MSFAIYLVRKERLKEAIDILNKEVYINVAECARKHDVKRKTLINQ